MPNTLTDRHRPHNHRYAEQVYCYE